MSVPSIGLFVLGSGTTSVMMIGMGMLLLGFSMGAEGDILAYLVIRHFGALRNAPIGQTVTLD